MEFVYGLTMAVAGFMGALLIEVVDRESDKYVSRQKQ